MHIINKIYSFVFNNCRFIDYNTNIKHLKTDRITFRTTLLRLTWAATMLRVPKISAKGACGENILKYEKKLFTLNTGVSKRSKIGRVWGGGSSPSLVSI